MVKPIAGYGCLLLLMLAIVQSCQKEIKFKTAVVSQGYLLKDATNACSLTQSGGNFITGRDLNDSNYLLVFVHHSKTGAYHITTNLVNGYSFSANGQFTDTGVNQVKLLGTGRPLAAGNDRFKITYDSTECEIVVAVTDTVPEVVQVNNSDHFPIATGNRWTYDDYTFPGDSVIRTILGDTMENSRPYKKANEYISFYPANNAQYYTKTGNDYFTYSSVSRYTDALTYYPSVYDDFNFLKENISSGFDWYSPVYSGRTGVGVQIADLQFHFTCTAADITLSVNGKTFQHVCVIEMTPATAVTGSTLLTTGEVFTSYYAKGIGLIYARAFNGILPHDVLKIRRWLIN